MLDDIALFVCLVEAGNFKKVAKIMSIQTSTVSKHIAELEYKLGKLLLVRDTRNIDVTEYGKFIYDRFKHLPTYLTDTIKHSSAKELRQNQEGELNICLGVAISYGLITPRLDEFVQKYPKIKLNINLSPNFTQWPSDDTNIVLAPTYIKGKNLENRFIRTEYARFFCSNAYAVKYGIPLTINDLSNHRIIGIMDVDNSPIDYLNVENINTKEIHLLNLKDVPIKMNNSIHMLQLGLNADYIFGSAESLCSKYLENGSIIPVLPEWVIYKLDFHLVTRKQVTEIEQIFIDFIYHCVGKTFNT